jgi:hypothetical protein
MQGSIYCGEEFDINIKRYSLSGELFPDFLLDHVADSWQGVAVAQIDPDICLKVDSALAFCGCDAPSARLRQFIYRYHQSDDFDYQTIAKLVQIFTVAGDDADVWDQLIALEFERDCGMGRDEYLTTLETIAHQLEQFTEPAHNLRRA